VAGVKNTFAADYLMFSTLYSGMKEQIKLSGDNREIQTGTANENALQIVYPAYVIDGVRDSLKEADNGELCLI